MTAWSNADNATLARMFYAGASDEDIAAAIGRTVRTVKRQRYAEGLSHTRYCPKRRLQLIAAVASLIPPPPEPMPKDWVAAALAGPRVEPAPRPAYIDLDACHFGRSEPVRSLTGCSADM